MENQAAVCFGTNCVLPGEAGFGDSRPREVAIAVCFLVLSLGIGCYPKLAMQVYDTTTVAINGQVTQAYTEFRQHSAIAIGDSSTAPSLNKVAELRRN
jgi:NAD(P)H-quinone oxidoreductase subunit 4